MTRMPLFHNFSPNLCIFRLEVESTGSPHKWKRKVWARASERCVLTGGGGGVRSMGGFFKMAAEAPLQVRAQTCTGDLVKFLQENPLDSCAAGPVTVAGVSS